MMDSSSNQAHQSPTLAALVTEGYEKLPQDFRLELVLFKPFGYRDSPLAKQVLGYFQMGYLFGTPGISAGKFRPGKMRMAMVTLYALGTPCDDKRLLTLGAAYQAYGLTMEYPPKDCALIEHDKVLKLASRKGTRFRPSDGKHTVRREAQPF
jgi:hypothetical protein